MPSVAAALEHSSDPPLHSKAELIELRRNVLRYARSFPPGFERNQRREIALSLRRLFKDKKWLDAHTCDGAAGGEPVDNRLTDPIGHLKIGFCGYSSSLI